MYYQLMTQWKALRGIKLFIFLLCTEGEREFGEGRDVVLFTPISIIEAGFMKQIVLNDRNFNSY